MRQLRGWMEFPPRNHCARHGRAARLLLLLPRGLSAGNGNWNWTGRQKQTLQPADPSSAATLYTGIYDPAPEQCEREGKHCKGREGRGAVMCLFKIACRAQDHFKWP
jgi:hypothetical protein